MTVDKADYPLNDTFDELFDQNGEARSIAAAFAAKLSSLSAEELTGHQLAADRYLQNVGITFNVYGHEQGTEKVWPFDVIPRIISGEEWRVVEDGLAQRIRALNLFIDDVYNEQRIIKDGVVPADLIFSSKTYREQCEGIRPPHSAWCHVTGTDLVRDRNGDFYVLEDNLRCPSGVSYVLTNRELMKRTFANVFQGMSIAPIDDYAEQLLKTLLECAPSSYSVTPTAVLLTPGVFNSAYFEHTFLAQAMGIELVEGSDLIVVDGFVQMKTTKGLQQVDVIYRRIDDDFLDPNCFRADSALGVKGLMDVYRAGRVNIANAPGTGIADDKAIYAYVPAIIRFYLEEDPVLKNVPTYLCSDETQRQHVLENLSKLVVKPTNESGGYGILMGPQSTKEEQQRCADEILKNPRDWIAQPMLNLSTVPTMIDGKPRPRHVDLRPFVLSGKDNYVMPGGLTRVALKEGSMIVNSSQGGGSKDTWVLTSVAQNQRSEEPTQEQSQATIGEEADKC